MRETDNTELTNVYNEFKQTHDIEHLKKFVDLLSTYKYYNVKYDFSIDDLFLEYSKDKPLIYYMLLHSNVMNPDYLKSLCSNPEIVKKCVEKNIHYIYQNLSDETFFAPFNYEGLKSTDQDQENESLIDYAINNDLLASHILDDIKSERVINRIIEKKPELLNSLDDEMLLNIRVNDGILLDYMFQNNIINKDGISRFWNNPVIYDYCKKYNRDDLIPFITETTMLCEVDGKTILETLLDEGVTPDTYFSNDKSFKIIMSKNRYDLLSNIDESSMLKEINGKAILETLLDKGISIRKTFLYREETLKIFIKYGKFDKIFSGSYSLATLLKNSDLNNTYLDVILEEAKRDDRLNLNDIRMWDATPDQKAAFYIAVAKHGLIEHVHDLDEQELLNDKKGKKLIDALLEQDQDLTINHIISKNELRKFDLSMYLKMKGIDIATKIDLEESDLVARYYDKYNERYKEVELPPETEKIFDEFRILMLADDLSDPKLVEDMITSYRYMVATGNIFGSEILKLIEIKKNNPNFCIKRVNEGAYYRGLDTSINLCDSGLSTLNHETGHALYHLLADKKMPEEYPKFVEQFKRDPAVLAKVQEYQRKFEEIKRSVSEHVNNVIMPKYDEEMKSMDKDKLTASLNRQKEEKMKIYQERGYSEEVLTTLFDRTFSVEEFLTNDRKIVQAELEDAVLRTEYGSFIAIGDIVDAIYGGKYRSNELVNQYGNAVGHAYGHGISYYSRGVELGFDETMANFSSIAKSKDANEVLGYLRNMFGDRFVNFIGNFYYNQVSRSTKDLTPQEEEKKASDML